MKNNASKRDTPRFDRARKQALTAWRGLDYAPLEEERRSTAKPIATVMKAVLQTVNLEKRQAESEIISVWNQQLDPGITEHAQPAGLRNGTLFVDVNNSALHYEIVQYRRREILERLQNSFGSRTIKRISFRVA